MKTLPRLLIVILSLLFLSFELALAGAPPLQWQKTFGGSHYDAGYCVQQTTDGGFIIAGSTHSFGAGSNDVYLIKTDHNGNSQWQKTFGGSAREDGYSVQQTIDGGYIVAGSTESYGAGFSDVYLIKTDPNGNSQWQKTFGGIYLEHAHSVRQTSDGGYIIAGGIYPYTTQDANIYVVKTDSNGTSQWQKTLGVIENSESVYSVQQTTDGGYIMAGSIRFPDPPNYDVYLIKTEPNGNTQWQKTFGGNDWESGHSVQQTADGGYIIAGHTFGSVLASSEVYLIKTDMNGNSQWQKTFGGSDYDVGLSVQLTSDGGYIIAGRSDSFSCLPYNSDVYLIKTDPNGNSQWQKTVGGSDKDTGYSVQQTFDGGYIIAGYTYYGEGDEYQYDGYLIKLCSDGTLSADFNCNGPVYFDDLQILLSQWLQPPGILSADIAPEPGDCIVNALDFAVLAQDWLKPVPGRAGNPDPLNNTSGISTTAKLSWTPGSNAVSHDVYFGTSALCMFRGNQTNTTFNPGTMAYNTRYYWRIDEVNPLGKTTGQVWSFTTTMTPPP